MATVREICHLRARSRSFETHPMIEGTDGVGVEIELEAMGTSYNEFSDPDWDCIPDGSLRNDGVEFVTRGDGIGGKQLFQAINRLDSYLKGCNPDDSWRCSSHVHVDVRDLTIPQLKLFILGYAIYERVLFKCSGWGRFKNNFCVPLGGGQTQVQLLAEHWERSGNDFLQNTVGNWNKYSAMNLLPIFNLGTVEFRMSEAKFHKGHLIKLVNRFLAIKSLAKSWEGSEADFIDYLQRTSIFETMKKGLPREVNIINEDVELGVKLAYDIVNTGKLLRRQRERALSEYIEGGFQVDHSYTSLNGFDSNWFTSRSLPASFAPFQSVEVLTYEELVILINIGARPDRLLMPESYERYIQARTAAENSL